MRQILKCVSKIHFDAYKHVFSMSDFHPYKRDQRKVNSLIRFNTYLLIEHISNIETMCCSSANITSRRGRCILLPWCLQIYINMIFLCLCLCLNLIMINYSDHVFIKIEIKFYSTLLKLSNNRNHVHIFNGSNE